MNTPKLRFKEFNDEWNYYLLNDLINTKSKIYNPNKNKTNYKCIELEHMNQNCGTINGYFQSLNQKSSKNIFYKDEVLFGKLRPYLRKYWYSTFDGVCSSEIWVLKSNNQKLIQNIFIFYIIQSNFFIQLCNLSTGSKMPRADWSYIGEQSVAIPTIKEQEKIGAFLSLLDKKIELQSKKIEALKLYTKQQEKGILDKMKFDNDILKCYVENICSIHTGKSNTQDKIENGIYPFYIRSEQIEHSNKYIFDCEAVLTIGDGNIGKVFFYVNGKFDCHQRVYVMNNFSKCILGKYFYYYFSNYFYRRAKLMSAKNTVDSIRQEMISKMNIYIPTIKRQQEIIKIFDTLEKKLDLEMKKYTKLESLKKGIMQKMLV